MSGSKGKIKREARDLFFNSSFTNDGKLLCAWCRIEVRREVDENNPIRATIDHITARCLGGSNRKENLVVACRSCNNLRSKEEGRRHERRLMHKRAYVRLS